MNFRYLIALAIYTVTWFVMDRAWQTSMNSALFTATVVALALSYSFYYLVRPRAERPQPPKSARAWSVLASKVAVGLLVMWVLAFVAAWAIVAPYICESTLALQASALQCSLGNYIGHAPFVTFLWSNGLLILSSILLPMVFWSVVRFTGRTKFKSPSIQRVGKKSSGTFLPTWIFANILGAIALLWAVPFNLNDETGFSFLATFPVYIIVAALLIFDAIVFIYRALKTPKGMRKRKIGYWSAASLSLSPIVVTGLYIFITQQTEQANVKRASTPISLQQAEQYITACKVDTLLRHNGGEMELKSYEISYYGQTARATRIYDVKYFDTLLALARSKSVQDKCGFVPSYDIERPKQPVVNQWIPEPEAASILGKCLESTNFYTDNHYLSSSQLPSPNTSGILLSSRLSVWNDETESTITLVGADSATATALTGVQNSCVRR